MLLEELREEALRQGYRLQKIPDWDCSCWREYPNETYRFKNENWKCVDKYTFHGYSKQGKTTCVKR